MLDSLYPYKQKIWTPAHTQGQRHMEIGVLRPQAKELPEARREAWNISFPTTFKESMALLTS